MNAPQTPRAAGELAPSSTDFVTDIIDEDLRSGRFTRVHTRFPPEPNGYLHIGHAKSICLNFGLARKYGGQCNLRFADTNPAREETEYVESILDDVRWLGWDWEDRLFFSSSYFDKFYEWAVQLIKQGQAYVDDQSAEEIDATRGGLGVPGQNSPYRNRSVQENLDLFERMRQGEFPDGARVLRAKIDMASPNLNLRDPVMYRIVHATHHRTGDKWCIYPMYDFEQGQSDSIEGITHSICTLEFEDHRPLFDWFLDVLGIFHRVNRVRPFELELHGHEQAQAARPGRGGPCRGLGRPPHADTCRAAAARLHARGHPRLLRACWGGQGQQQR